MFLRPKKFTGTAWMLIVLLFFLTSCEKEYSYENGQVTVRVDPPAVDSNLVIIPEFHYCSLCDPAKQLQVSEWSFRIDTSVVCGIVDTAIINFERTAFTFFGPSSCAGDTGLIFTVYLDPFVLDKDTYNFTVPYASFYYYRTGYPNLLANRTDQSFTFTITSYIHATRIATGVFSGTAYRPDARPAVVHTGKFKIQLN